MSKQEKQLILWSFEYSKRRYSSLFKNHSAWNLKRIDLLKCPKGSFGRELGVFLYKNNFELIPKVERHDCYHVLCNYSRKVEDEIALQCLCFGNGKRSPYLYGAILLSIIIRPNYYDYYYQFFNISKRANIFHNYDYIELLTVNIEDFRQMIFSKQHLIQLKIT